MLRPRWTQLYVILVPVRAPFAGVIRYFAGTRGKRMSVQINSSSVDIGPIEKTKRFWPTFSVEDVSNDKENERCKRVPSI